MITLATSSLMLKIGLYGDMSQIFADEPMDLYDELSSELKQPAIEMLQRELGEEFTQWYRDRVRTHDSRWWLPKGWHFIGGMAIRNLLREQGFGEAYFGIHNLDDVYIELVEGAIGNGQR